VRWQGFPRQQDTWEDSEALQGLTSLIDDFTKHYPTEQRRGRRVAALTAGQRQGSPDWGGMWEVGRTAQPETAVPTTQEATAPTPTLSSWSRGAYADEEVAAEASHEIQAVPCDPPDVEPTEDNPPRPRSPSSTMRSTASIAVQAGADRPAGVRRMTSVSREPSRCRSISITASRSDDLPP
jgi:hypothetical protein